MSNGGRPEGGTSSHRSSPIPRGPSTPTSTSPFSDPQRTGQSLLAGRYTLGLELGRGSNGRVFKAFDQEDGRFVAIKQIPIEGVPSEQLAGVVQEIELLKILDHQNIVQYYDSIKSNKHLYIILEYMESGSLAGVIKQTNYGSFSERWVAFYVAQVLNGLKYLHAQGVVHRDIKGANILTTKEMVIKLADFGVAEKLVNRGSRGRDEKADGTVVGSPYWMAPEMIELSSVTTAADIWSIGCLVIELLTGSAPYFECQPIAALFKIVKDPHPPLPQGISASLRHFLLSCFIKDPLQRPTAKGLLEMEWITENQDRSVSPNKTASAGSSPAPSVTAGGSSNTNVLQRILRHGVGTRPYKAASDQNSEMETGAFPERVDSSSMLSRSSSVVNDTPPTDVTDEFEVDSYGRIDRRMSDEKPPKSLPVYSQSIRPSVEKPPPNRFDSTAQSDTTTASTERKTWRDDSQHAEKETISTHIASGTSSPDARLGSSPMHHKEESLLTSLFSERVYVEVADFESGLQRTRDGESWDLYRHRHQRSLSEEYDPKDIRKVMSSIRPDLPLSTIAPALRDLVNLMHDDVESKSIFVHTDGLLTLLELLLQCHDYIIVEQTLIATNSICGSDALMLTDAATMGLAAEVFKYTQKTFPMTIRLSAAQFLRSMSFASVRSRDCLMQCQGLKSLVQLLEDGERKSLELKEIALSCLSHVVEEHAAIESKILRLLCMVDLPHRLVMALLAVHYDTFHQQDSSLNLQGLLSSHELVDDYPVSARSENQQKAGSYSSRVSDVSAAPPEPGTPETLNETLSIDASERRSSENSVTATESLQQSARRDASCSAETRSVSPAQNISDKIMDLMFKISLSDNEVQGYLFRPGTLEQFLLLLRLPSLDMIYRVVVCLKHLSQKSAVLEHLQQAEVTRHLIPLLGRQGVSEMVLQIKDEVLVVVDSICTCKPQWRDRAVREGIVPLLYVLSQKSIENALKEPRHLENNIRNTAITLLCRLLTRSSSATRRVFWENSVADLFLELLDEDVWRQVVLDALATWLEEDIHQVEEKLLLNSSVQNLISILRVYRYRSSNEISAVLDPLLRMLTKSDRLSRIAGEAGLARVIMEMLPDSDAATALRLLKSLKRIYGVHPRPKAFLSQYNVTQSLAHLASSSSSTSAASARVLVQKEAADLLSAFNLNQLW